MPRPSLPCSALFRSEAELRQIRKATLLGTVNNLVFIGGPILIAMGGEAERECRDRGGWGTLNEPVLGAPPCQRCCQQPSCVHLSTPRRRPAGFLTYTLCGYPLTASTAFPALALFNLLRFPVMMVPQQVSAEFFLGNKEIGLGSRRAGQVVARCKGAKKMEVRGRQLVKTEKNDAGPTGSCRPRLPISLHKTAPP